jgi:hypothetical protein
MIIVLSTKQWHVGYFLNEDQIPYHSSTISLVFVDEAPHTLIVKTKNNQLQRPKATLLKVLHSYLISRYQWEGRCLRLRISVIKPCHVLCQLGLGLEINDLFRLSEFIQSQMGRGHIHDKLSGIFNWQDQNLLHLLKCWHVALAAHKIDNLKSWKFPNRVFERPPQGT